MTADPRFSHYPRYNELAYACGHAPVACGDFKTEPEDFRVEEVLGFTLSGAGEHLWLWVEARDMNTEFLVRQLAMAFELEKKAVSYSGKKDRRAVTRQWFSLHMPGRFASESAISLPDNLHPDLNILKAQLHHKKLRRGTHKQNRFEVRIRHFQGDHGHFGSQVARISSAGFPNYFGFQRFGHHENNIVEACSAITSARRLKRDVRDRVFSSLRAWDFNHQLSLRVSSQTWSTYLAGDTLQLNGSQSLFQPDHWDEELQARLDQGDIHIAGVLPGKGERRLPLPEGDYVPAPPLQEYLVKQRVEQGGRAFRVIPEALQCDFDGNDVVLSFTLPSGAYATALLRELLQLKQPA